MLPYYECRDEFCIFYSMPSSSFGDKFADEDTFYSKSQRGRLTGGDIYSVDEDEFLS
jgi:hypothetical protein